MLSSKAILHVTNSVYSARKLQGSNIPGVTLPWQDVLYEGPALAGLSLDEFSQARASYFSQIGWGGYPSLLSHFSERNKKIKTMDHYDSVALWFDADVYSQLQQVQVLDWLAGHSVRSTYIYIVSLYGGCKKPFLEMDSKAIQCCYEKREEVTLSQFETASLVWDAFTSGDPHRLVEMTRKDISSIPNLKTSMLRLLQQLPSSQNGLSRIEFLVLKAVSKGYCSLSDVHSWVRSRDAEMLLTEGMLKVNLRALLSGKKPSLRVDQSVLKLTEFGTRLLSEDEDQIEVNGVDRWLGGLHLVADNIWRYNHRDNSVVRTYM